MKVDYQAKTPRIFFSGQSKRVNFRLSIQMWPWQVVLKHYRN